VTELPAYSFLFAAVCTINPGNVQVIVQGIASEKPLSVTSKNQTQAAKGERNFDDSTCSITIVAKTIYLLF